MKEEIENYLFYNGFEKSGDNSYVKHLQHAVGEMIVNGEHRVQTETLEIKFQYVGDGWEGESEENNKPLTQWKLIVQGEDQGDFLVHNAEEFKQIFVK